MVIEIPSGSLVLSCGVTGAGKTTLMKKVEREIRGTTLASRVDFIYHDEIILSMVDSLPIPQYMINGGADSIRDLLVNGIIQIVGDGIHNAIRDGKTLVYDSPFVYAQQIDAFLSLIKQVRCRGPWPSVPPPCRLVIVKFYPSEEQEVKFLNQRYRKLEADYERRFGKTGISQVQRQRGQNFALMRKERVPFQQIVDHQYCNDSTDGLIVSEHLVVDASTADIRIVP